MVNPYIYRRVLPLSEGCKGPMGRILADKAVRRCCLYLVDFPEGVPPQSLSSEGQISWGVGRRGWDRGQGGGGRLVYIRGPVQ